MYIYYFLALLVNITFIYGMSTQALIIMGPSCAGKSTIAKKLVQQLNRSNQPWKILEVDDIEDEWRAKQIEYSYDNLIAAAIEATNQMLSDTNVILVTNIYRQTLRTIKANLIKFNSHLSFS